MFAINATVCEGSDTDATVSLEFSTTGATCSTEDLRHEGHKTWFRYGGKHLGNCKSFRPIDGLQAKIWGVDAPADQLKFCKLTVNFGNFWKYLENVWRLVMSPEDFSIFTENSISLAFGDPTA